LNLQSIWAVTSHIAHFVDNSCDVCSEIVGLQVKNAKIGHFSSISSDVCSRKVGLQAIFLSNTEKVAISLDVSDVSAGYSRVTSKT